MGKGTGYGDVVRTRPVLEVATTHEQHPVPRTCTPHPQNDLHPPHSVRLSTVAQRIIQAPEGDLRFRCAYKGSWRRDSCAGKCCATGHGGCVCDCVLLISLSTSTTSEEGEEGAIPLHPARVPDYLPRSDYLQLSRDPTLHKLEQWKLNTSGPPQARHGASVVRAR